MSSKIKSGNVSFDLKRFAGIKRDYSKEDIEKLKKQDNELNIKIDALKNKILYNKEDEI